VILLLDSLTIRHDTIISVEHSGSSLVESLAKANRGSAALQ